MRPLRALRLSLAGLFLANTAMSADDCQPESWKAAALHAGRINCRDGVTTESKVDSNTCALLASKNRLSMKAFFDLNPRLGGDCQSILPDTMYCVNGFPEPVRAYNGLCGPDNGNATDDCTVNCYEGNCY
ncbi:LysM domain-containing protein [Fusarium keratoplasticum]|uniref:LysM domain-containing protein n=1 Tax=Fusarium keratoplasticum TaxID=1328300 RepID=A0ACC0QHQ0_9HYPO|nr:LysM domain-containing protein [Fusarium keratoplasticum]KAI8654435.1 LysM domain-containing protein [Fusarium keratoplasticum]KAI8655324.1 LysM domain-containing protein [Fusarium keratoplasticum]